MLPGLKTYGAKPSARQPLVDFIIQGLSASGCRILFNSDTRQAPFVITFETAAGERMGIVAYAFLATRTPTKNRPKDERSFQIKYGKKEKVNSHQLWVDPFGLYTTLLVGIDPKDGIFVGADPAMHNPTKFFIRLEFKDQHVEEIRSRGWFAWEREKKAGSHTDPIEVLVGGTKNSFLDFVRFERAAQGLAPGDRQLLSEKPELFSARDVRAGQASRVDERVIHPLAKEFALDSDQILELIAGARRLKMAVRGWVAEEHLRDTLCKVAGVTHCRRLDEEGSPDIELKFKGGRLLRLECKNTLRGLDAQKRPRIDFQRTRASKGNPCSRYYERGDFDIVAGCLHAVTEKWEFRYVLTSEMSEHAKCAGKLASNVRIDASWASDPVAIFKTAYSR